ncbi:uncharacterized protein H6S33_005499 [Morchella sextelata]|uniref:uncharacterized protein n=1 Tax=Morchella sextelata TaxID=1174677 RepID=UPI001D04E88C|nr:uncharacterized protein H6S33_005499 [Morchella sextelata]KAH0613613.1 hypothetical protein H6S33_005499 [Morchella sextelata]
MEKIQFLFDGVQDSRGVWFGRDRLRSHLIDFHSPSTARFLDGHHCGFSRGKDTTLFASANEGFAESQWAVR